MLSAITIFVSAFLLFLVQPLIAKQILPWFGGSAAVWTMCLVFFQTLLLAGYTYAHLLSRWPLRRQAVVHTVLVLAACLTLPIIADASWKPGGDADPTQRILLVLAATIGLPYLVVCTSGPLVQSWYSRVHAGDARQALVYRLFALSNLASLAALVAYPFVVEPYAPLRSQALSWSAGFGVFAVLVITLVWRSARQQAASGGAVATAPEAALQAQQTQPVPSLSRHVLWLLLAGLGTVMLLSVTAHITQNVASVPFLWVLPLTLYLLTFVLCFDSQFWYRRWLFWPAVVVLVPTMAWALGAKHGLLSIYQALPIFAVGLFAVCMLCHGELVRAKPAPVHLTRFYLMVSLGGAVGGLLVGTVAPRVFNGYFELPLALALALWSAVAYWQWQMPVAGLLIMAVVLGATMAAFLTLRTRSVGFASGLFALLGLVACVYFSVSFVYFTRDNTVMAVRNFYGELRVREHDFVPPVRELAHGVILHGVQVTTPELSTKPASYYGETSGIGLAVRKTRSAHQRIGVIGLGVGTMAAYGTPGGTVRFYEINPEVLRIASNEFTYLRDSASKVETVLGDARLVLEREAQAGQMQKFDVLLVDAFSGDSVPVHLITREALEVYRRHMAPGGIIAFHISNRYLNLGPVVAQLAHHAGLEAAQIPDTPPAEQHWLSNSVYVLVTDSQAFLNDPQVRARQSAIVPVPGLALWTDDYNNLFKILIR